jgi:hypothetical protein
MRQEAHQLGAVMDQESINSTQELWLSLKNVGHVFSSLGWSIMGAIMPALKKIAQGCEYFGTGLNKVFKNTTVLKTALAILALIATDWAIDMVIGFAPVILTFAGVAAAVAAVILVVDELYNLFTGGDSLTGRFFDKIKTGLQNWIPELEAQGKTVPVQFIENLVGRAPTPKITSSSPVKHSTHHLMPCAFLAPPNKSGWSRAKLSIFQGLK